MIKLKQPQVKEYRENMLKDQGGKCAFCNQDAKKPCLDHSHMEPHKDKIRGVICNWCNIALGKLENARVRTGTSWADFAISFPHAYWYIDRGSYIASDWHPSKRKSEVVAFKKMKAIDQEAAILALLPDNYAPQGTMPKNATQRVALYKKLNNKT